MALIRILFLADSHLGLDLPARPRVARRRRGHDFLANHAAAVRRAFAGDIDLVVHGGDVFDRPRASAALAHQAYHPLLEVADRGVPVFIVPGNHERGQLPHARFLRHARVHVFDGPRAFQLVVRGRRIVLAGFPYERRAVRTRFGALLQQTDAHRHAADVRLLCIHHCVEGATVGPGDFTFTSAPDVIRCADLPPGYAAVLSGHIHRHQVLTTDLSGRALDAPVFYPGSIERTSVAEIGEDKGYLVLDVDAGAEPPRVRWRFEQLPARPMLVRRLVAPGDAGALDRALRELVLAAPSDAVLRVRVEGPLTEAHLRVLSAARIRAYAPAGMNVEIRADAVAPPRAGRPAAPDVVGRSLQLEL